jgi:hypothetical protein
LLKLSIMAMVKKKKHIILKGEGVNQHVLHGDFMIEETPEFSKLVVNKNGVLKHEKPSGEFAEHKSLAVESGNWVMGKQVEYNPFNQEITRIWD